MSTTPVVKGGGSKAQSSFATRNHYWLRRLHSLSGIVPIGGFMLFHLYINAFALNGAAAFNKAAGSIEDQPGVRILEWVVIFIPLLYHAFYGLYIFFYAKQNKVHYAYYRNWAFFLQRWTAIIALFFILYHTVALRFLTFGGKVPPNYTSVMQHLTDPWVLLIYVVGLLATTFHLTNGIWAFLVSWGLTVGPRAQRVSAYVCGFLFIAISLLGVAIATHFYLVGNGVLGTILS